jgi:hypothetical protein
MEINASAGLELTIVDSDPSVARHDAQQSSLLFTSPAPDAGTYRGGHRNRLTPSIVRRIPRVDHAGLRWGTDPSQATFPVS